MHRRCNSWRSQFIIRKILTLSRFDLRYRFPSFTTTWSPFPQWKADGYRNLTVGLTRFIFSINLIRVWWRQPAAKAYGYRSSLIFGIRCSFSSRAALLTPKALLFSVHWPLITVHCQRPLSLKKRLRIVAVFVCLYLHPSQSLQLQSQGEASAGTSLNKTSFINRLIKRYASNSI